MPMHALEDLDDAYAATKSFLWPINRSRWLKLAIVVFFLGGPGTGSNIIQSNIPAEQAPPTGLPPLPDIGPRIWVVVTIVVAAVVLIGLLFLLIRSVMDFIFIESLRQEEVTVRRYWAQRWRQGVRLFGFRLVIGLFVLGSAATVAGFYLLPLMVNVGPGTGGPLTGISLVAVLLLFPVIVVLAVLVGLISGFTTVFVVPIMVLEDCGVIAGWRRLWPTITQHPWQYLAYAVAGFVLSIAGGILVAIAVGIAVIVLLIPFGILGAIGFFLLTTVPPFGIGVLAIVGLLFGLAVLVMVAIAQVPVVTYLRYYALFVLGDIEPDLDLIPDGRASVRMDAE